MDALSRDGGYHQIDRRELLPLIPAGSRRVLDVGCATGGFGSTVRAALGAGATLDGVEATAEQAELARHGRGYDEVRTGYFPDAPESADREFDLICFNDVLEHMADPWSALRAARGLLSDDGQVMARIPNMRVAPVLWGLIRGRWDYADDGVLDRTHFRFFTRGSIESLFTDTGYVVERCEGINNVVRMYPHRFAGHSRKVRHLLGDTQWMQYAVVAHSA